MVEEKTVLTVSSSRKNDALTWGQDGFSIQGVEGNFRTLKIEEDEAISSDWKVKQDSSLTEYLDSYVYGQSISPTSSIYKLFAIYVKSMVHDLNGPEQLNVLDVGCGIGKNHPSYIDLLADKVNYLGLDAIDIHPNRDYPFICSRIETMSEFSSFHKKMDAFIFGTSLDHFENYEDVSKMINKMATPGAISIFWIGLHDVPLVAGEEGVRIFQRIFEDEGPLTVMGHFLKFVFLRFPRLFYALQRRRKRLKNNTNLDEFHFNYFRVKDLPEVLSCFGEIIDITMIPGTTSVFCTCQQPSNLTT